MSDCSVTAYHGSKPFLACCIPYLHDDLPAVQRTTHIQYHSSKQEAQCVSQHSTLAVRECCELFEWWLTSFSS